ncbi:MAG: uroporphyrinogen-III synthase [Pseudomonadota bacterium]
MAKVLLTRPALRAAQLIARLEALGHEVHNVPVMEIVGLEAADMPSQSPQGTLFTSAAAVPFVPEPLLPHLQPLPALAVGPATAEALGAAGWRDVQHFGGEIGALLAALRERPKLGPWLYPCGTELSHDPDDLAQQSGAEILPVPVYGARVRPAWDAATQALVGQSDWDFTFFMSARTATLFAEQIQAAGLWAAGPPGTALAISPAVAKAVEPLNFHTLRIAGEKTTSSLVAAMAVT